MKKIYMMVIVLAVLTAFLLVKATAAELGVGLNNMGGQIRWGILEIGTTLEPDANAYFGRLYFNQPKKLWYSGVEAALINSKYISGGFEVGAFTGLNIRVKKFSIFADIGAYYTKLDSCLGSYGEVTSFINTGVNYYFGGGSK